MQKVTRLEQQGELVRQSVKLCWHPIIFLSLLAGKCATVQFMVSFTKFTIFRSNAFDVIHLGSMGGGCVSGLCSCGSSMHG